jgi:decaprenyl-phosphate phosphoribosyltransferase
VMAIYFKLSFKEHSAVQNPEKLYREPSLMLWFTATVVVMVLLLFIRLPRLEGIFMPTLPVVQPTTRAALPGSEPQGFESAGTGRERWLMLSATVRCRLAAVAI